MPGVAKAGALVTWAQIQSFCLAAPTRRSGLDQKTVTIPEAWRGKRVTLFLERPHWQSEVWVDGKPAGMRNSLATPHVYDLGQTLAPGPHRLAICVGSSTCNRNPARSAAENAASGGHHEWKRKWFRP